jgi:hypothetical protein
MDAKTFILYLSALFDSKFIALCDQVSSPVSNSVEVANNRQLPEMDSIGLKKELNNKWQE